MASGVTDSQATRCPSGSGATTSFVLSASCIFPAASDDREILLKTAERIFSRSQGAGHEAIQTAAGMASTRPATTGSSPTIATARCAHSGRDRRKNMLLQAVGAAPTRFRRPPDAFPLELPRLHIVSGSSRHRHPVPAGARLRRRAAAYWIPAPTRSRWSSTGDGATSEGEFWESLNSRLPGAACRCCTWSRTTARPSPFRSKSRPPAAISPGWFPDFPTCYDLRSATAPISSPPTRPCSQAIEHCRAGAVVRSWSTPAAPGPIRIRSPTTSGFTKTKAERAAEARRDPAVKTFPEWLLRRGHARSPTLRSSHARNRSRNPADHPARSQELLRRPPVRRSSSFIPTGSIPRPRTFDAEPRFHRRSAHHGRFHQSHTRTRRCAAIDI